VVDELGEAWLGLLEVVAERAMVVMSSQWFRRAEVCAFATCNAVGVRGGAGVWGPGEDAVCGCGSRGDGEYVYATDVGVARLMEERA
jgi:hypothetical protein